MRVIRLWHLYYSTFLQQRHRNSRNYDRTPLAGELVKYRKKDVVRKSKTTTKRRMIKVVHKPLHQPQTQSQLRIGSTITARHGMTLI